MGITVNIVSDVRLVVVVRPSTNDETTLRPQTYPVRSQRLSTTSVVEAVLTTCTTQPEFT
jgi:hypothetical protein